MFVFHHNENISLDSVQLRENSRGRLVDFNNRTWMCLKRLVAKRTTGVGEKTAESKRNNKMIDHHHT